jgi:hypothetical protein
MDLDPIAGWLCATTAAAVFYLHAASSPDRKSWISLPPYVRFGFVAAGATFTLRSVDFFSIAGKDVSRGHINFFGILSAAALAYLAVVSVICVYRSRMRNGQWHATQEAVETLQADPDAVLAVIPKSHAVPVLRTLGAVAAGPGEPPEVLND